MNTLTICPCCSNTMLHYINNRRDYWFCRNCWQEMPNLNSVEKLGCNNGQNRILNLSIGLNKLVAVAH